MVDIEQGEQTQYYGYQLKSAADFEVEEIPDDLHDNQANVFVANQSNISLDTTRNDVVSVACASFSVAFFLSAVIILSIGADCNLGLCEWIDSSSLSDTVYAVQVFNFVAPLRFVWGSLLVVSLSMSIASIYAIFLLKMDMGSDTLRVVSAVLGRQGKKQILLRICVAYIALLPIFLLTGFSSGWRSASCVYIGGSLTLLTCFVSSATASRLGLRIAALSSDRLTEKVNIARITGTIITLTTLSCGFGGLSFCYLLMKDLRALIGFALGSLTSAMCIAICGGIYYKSVNVASPLANNSESHKTNIFVFCEALMSRHLSILTGKLSILTSGFCAIFATAVIATAVKGTSFPFFHDNSYAMCTFNHLILDKNCVSINSENMKQTFAATLCRLDDFHLEYPKLTTWQSNSLFIAFPFILAFTCLAVTTLCTTYVPLPKVPAGMENELGQNEKQKSISTRLWLIVILTAILSIICAAGLCWGLFGNNSDFYNANSGTFETYELTKIDGSSSDSCRPTIGQDQLSNNVLPDLTLSSGPYQPLNGDGSRFPPITGIAWRLFMCYFIGIIVGFFIGESGEFFLLFRTASARKLIAAVINGSSMALVEMFGCGFAIIALPAIGILFVLIVSFTLFGGYGIGIASIGMLSTAGSFLHLAVNGIILESSDKMIKATKSSFEIHEHEDGLERVAKPFINISSRYICGCIFVVACNLLLLVSEEANFIPSSRQLVGNIDGRPSKHITDIIETNMIDIFVFVSFFIGIILTFLFSTSILFGTSRITQLLVTELKARFGNIGNSMRNANILVGVGTRCKEISGGWSLLESIIPMLIATIGPIVIGFGFGQRAMISVILGIITGSFGQCSGFNGLTRSWNIVEDYVHDKNDRKYEIYDESLEKMIEIRNGIDDGLNEGIGSSIMIFGAMSSCLMIVIIRMMQVDLRKGWIGLIVLIGLMLLCIGILLIIGTRLQKGLEMYNTNGEFEMKSMKKVPQIVSPFYEEGPTIRRSHISPTSQLGAARMDHTIISSIEI